MKRKKPTRLSETVEQTEPCVMPKDALDAFTMIASELQCYGMGEEVLEKTADCTDYLKNIYGFTPVQSLLLAAVIDEGCAVSARDLAHRLSIRNAEMLRYTLELDSLVEEQILTKKRSEGDAYEVRSEALIAFCKSVPFTKRKMSGLNAEEMFEELGHIFDEKSVYEIDDREFKSRLQDLLDSNPGANVSIQMKQYDLSQTDRTLLLFFLHRYVNNDDNLLHFLEVQNLFTSQLELRRCRQSLINGDNALMRNGLIEGDCNDGIVDISHLRLTQKAKQQFLEGLGLRFDDGRSSLGLTRSESIVTKELFYNSTEEEQIKELTGLLCQDKFCDVQRRLKEEGMRTGFACLFYGAPGTGKTETALQIARLTGRDIMQVNLSTVRDKYVGETEKNVKAIFDSYRAAVRRQDKAPILLLNEADAIICRRSTNADRSADKMENAMQNIMLQEMEQLEGILIATTNLTENMDKAFSRRFIYKIEFNRPSTNTKAAIWHSMLPRLTEEESLGLAESFDLSGGQIENIVRKQTVDYVLSGVYPSIDRMNDYCRAEVAGDYSQTRSIGF